MGIALYLFSRLSRMKSFARPLFIGIERGRRVLSSYCFQTIDEVRFRSVPRLPYSQCSRSSGVGSLSGREGARTHEAHFWTSVNFASTKRTDLFRVGRGMRFSLRHLLALNTPRVFRFRGLCFGRDGKTASGTSANRSSLLERSSAHPRRDERSGVAERPPALGCEPDTRPRFERICDPAPMATPCATPNINDREGKREAFFSRFSHAMF